MSILYVVDSYCTAPFIITDPAGPGTFSFVCAAQFFYSDGDAVVATARLRFLEGCEAPLTISTVPGFETVVGFNSSYVYDPDILPNVVTIYKQDIDSDSDGICDSYDNCTNTSNGPDGGTCTEGDTFKITQPCSSDIDCGIDGFCSMNQEDTDEDSIGDACHFCEGDFQCDLDVDGLDAATFKQDYGRSIFLNPCTNNSLCNGDFDCDNDCDGTDAARFKADFSRNPLHPNPCPPCEVGIWCVYP